MEKEFVPNEQAIALKELGFDEECLGHYQQEWHEDGITELEPSLKMINSKQHQHAYQLCTVPLYQQVFRWFREKHELQHEIVYDISNDLINKVYVYSIFGTDRSEEYKTYEEAELECLIKLIEIVKTNDSK